MIDDIDRTILTIVQQNTRTSNADIARQVGMAPSAILERIRKLEKRGLIEGYPARLNPTAVGLGLLAFVFVKTNESMSELCTGEKLAQIPEIQEVHHVAGEDCYLVKVRSANTQALGNLLREKLGKLPSVISTRTTVVLDTIKEDCRLPLEESGGGDP